MNYLRKFLVTTFLCINTSANIHLSVGPLIISRPFQPSYDVISPLSEQWFRKGSGHRSHDLSVHYKHGVPTLLGTQSLASNVWHQLYDTAEQLKANHEGADENFKLIETEDSYVASHRSGNKLEVLYVNDNVEPKSTGGQRGTSKIVINSPLPKQSQNMDLTVHATSKQSSVSESKTKRENLEQLSIDATVSPKEDNEVTSSSNLDQTLVTHDYEGTSAVVTADDVNDLEASVNLSKNEMNTEELISPEFESASLDFGKSSEASQDFLSADTNESSIPVNASDVLVSNTESFADSVEQVQMEYQLLDNNSTAPANESSNFKSDTLIPVIPEKVIEPHLPDQESVTNNIEAANDDMDYSSTIKLDSGEENVEQTKVVADAQGFAFEDENSNLNNLLLPIIPGKVNEAQERKHLSQRNIREGFAYEGEHGSNDDDDYYRQSLLQDSPRFSDQDEGIVGFANMFKNQPANTVNIPDLPSNQVLGYIGILEWSLDTHDPISNQVYQRSTAQTEPYFLKYQQDLPGNSWKRDSRGQHLFSLPSTLAGKAQDLVTELGQNLKPQSLFGNVNLPRLLEKDELYSGRPSLHEKSWLTPSVALRKNMPNTRRFSNELDIPIPQNLEEVVEAKLLNSGAYSNNHEEATQDVIDVIGSLNSQVDQEVNYRRSNPVLKPQEHYFPPNFLNDVLSHPRLPHMKRIILEFQEDPDHVRESIEQLSLPHTKPHTRVLPDNEDGAGYLLESLTNAQIQPPEDNVEFNVSPFHLEQLESPAPLPITLLSAARGLNLHARPYVYNDFTRPKLHFLETLNLVQPSVQKKQRVGYRAKRNSLMEFANSVVADVAGPVKSMVPNFSFGVPDLVSARMDRLKLGNNLHYIETAKSGSITLEKHQRSKNKLNKILQSRQKRKITNMENLGLPEGFLVNFRAIEPLIHNKQTEAENLKKQSLEIKNADGYNGKHNDRKNYRKLQNLQYIGAKETKDLDITGLASDGHINKNMGIEKSPDYSFGKTLVSKPSPNENNIEPLRNIEPNKLAQVIKHRDKDIENAVIKVRTKRDNTDGVITLDLPGGLSVNLGSRGELFQSNDIAIKKSMDQLNTTNKIEELYRVDGNVGKQPVSPDLEQTVTKTSEGTKTLVVTSNEDADFPNNLNESSNMVYTNVTQSESSVNISNSDSARSGSIDLSTLFNQIELNSNNKESTLKYNRIKRNPAYKESLSLPGGSVSLGLFQNKNKTEKHELRSNVRNAINEYNAIQKKYINDQILPTNLEQYIKKISEGLDSFGNIFTNDQYSTHDPTGYQVDKQKNSEKFGNMGITKNINTIHSQIIHEQKTNPKELLELEHAATESSDNTKTKTTDINHYITHEYKAQPTQSLDLTETVLEKPDDIHAPSNITNTTEGSFTTITLSYETQGEPKSTVATDTVESPSSTMEAFVEDSMAGTIELSNSLTESLESAEPNNENDKPHVRKRRDFTNYKYFAIKRTKKPQSYVQLSSPGYRMNKTRYLPQYYDIQRIAENSYFNKPSPKNVYWNQPTYLQSQKRFKRFLPFLNTQVSIASELRNGASIGRSLSFRKSLGVQKQSQTEISKGIQFGIRTQRSLSSNKQRFRRDCLSCQQGSNNEKYEDMGGQSNYGYTDDQNRNYGEHNVEDVFGPNGEPIQVFDLTEDLILDQPETDEEKLKTGLLDVIGNFVEDMDSSEIDFENDYEEDKLALIEVTTDYMRAGKVNVYSTDKNETQKKRNIENEHKGEEIVTEIVKKDDSNGELILSEKKLSKKDANVVDNISTADVTQNLDVIVEHTDNVTFSGTKEVEDYEFTIGSHSKIDVKEGRSGNITIEITHSGLNPDVEVKTQIQPTESLQPINHNKDAEQNYDIGSKDSDIISQIDKNLETGEDANVKVFDSGPHLEEIVILDIDSGLVENAPNEKISEENGVEMDVNHQTTSFKEEVQKSPETINNSKITQHLEVTREVNRQKLPEAEVSNELGHKRGVQIGQNYIARENKATFPVVNGLGNLEVTHHLNTLALKNPILGENRRGDNRRQYRTRYSNSPNNIGNQGLLPLPYNIEFSLSPLSLMAKARAHIGRNNNVGANVNHRRTGSNVGLSGKLGINNFLPEVSLDYGGNLSGDYNADVLGKVLGLSSRFLSTEFDPKFGLKGSQYQK